jgi:hypothetical protein
MEIFSRYYTDKTHKRLTVYNTHLSRYRWSDRVLLIGGQNGEWVRAFREFCPEAEVLVVDADRSRLLAEERIQSACLDVTEPLQLVPFCREYLATFNVIACDCPLRTTDHLLLVRSLRRCLRWGGLMMIEGVDADEFNLFEAEGCRIDGDVAIYQKLEN